MMAGIQARNTRPERTIRLALHRRGFRYRLHRADLPGKPDLVFGSRRAVMLIHGCFWHGHGCNLFRWPKTRPDFWRNKIGGNIERDQRLHACLTGQGWRVATIWECALKGTDRLDFTELIEQCARWLQSDIPTLELRGLSPTPSVRAASCTHNTTPASGPQAAPDRSGASWDGSDLPHRRDRIPR